MLAKRDEVRSEERANKRAEGAEGAEGATTNYPLTIQNLKIPNSRTPHSSLRTPHSALLKKTYQM
ncbi:hypothetical protein [Chroococcidiopsis sp.]|uniref:hypothetical protein n=1 Tax=Chroococcidiopsis sp. TaxID=3088168 RepID=UPI003F3D6D12